MFFKKVKSNLKQLYSCNFKAVKKLLAKLLLSTFIEKVSAVTAIALFAYTAINLKNNEVYQSWIAINSSLTNGNSAGIYESLKTLHDNKQNLSGINFKNVNLIEADLSNSNISETNFRGSNLTGTNFRNSMIRKTDFRDTDISKANFSGSKNYFHSSPWSEDSGTNFSNSYVSCQDPIRFHPLGPTDMNISENFDKSLTHGADFSRAILINASFKNSILTGTNFNNSILIYPDFEGADLSFTSFKGALLASPNFKGATLLCSTGVKSNTEFAFDFESELSSLQKEQIEGAKFMSPGIDFGCPVYHKIIKDALSERTDKVDPVLELVQDLGNKY